VIRHYKFNDFVTLHMDQSDSARLFLGEKLTDQSSIIQSYD